jgi:hypothetical protein
VRKLAEFAADVVSHGHAGISRNGVTAQRNFRWGVCAELRVCRENAIKELKDLGYEHCHSDVEKAPKQFRRFFAAELLMKTVMMELPRFQSTAEVNA